MPESRPPTLRDQLAGHVGTAAKAIAAFVTPIVALLVAGLIEQIGVDIPFDPSAFEAFVTAVVTAFLVWLIANRPSTPTDPED